MRSVQQLAEQLVHLLLEAFIPLLRPSQWDAFNVKGRHGLKEFTRHVLEPDLKEQLSMLAKLSFGNLQIVVPDDQGWYLIMPGGYAIEGAGNQGRTYIGKTEATMPRLFQVSNPYMSPKEIQMWRYGL